MIVASDCIEGRFFMKRRKFLKNTALTAGALGASSLFPLASSQKKPNVIVILTDDIGHGDFSRHGHPFLKRHSWTSLPKKAWTSRIFTSIQSARRREGN